MLAWPLLPLLVEKFQRCIPELPAHVLATVATRLGSLIIDQQTAEMISAAFCTCPLDLDLAVKIVNALQICRRPNRAVLARVGDWVAARVNADGAVHGDGAEEDRGHVLGPPAAAAELLCSWRIYARLKALPMPAVWGLARSAAAGVGAPGAVCGVDGRKLSHTLYALAVLVKESQRAGWDMAHGSSRVPLDLGAGIAGWAGLAVDRVVPGAAYAGEDLGWALWGARTLGIVPEAAAGASTVAKVSAVALSLERSALLHFVQQVLPALVLWQDLGACAGFGAGSTRAGSQASCLNPRQVQLYVWPVCQVANKTHGCLPSFQCRQCSCKHAARFATSPLAFRNYQRCS